MLTFPIELKILTWSKSASLEVGVPPTAMYIPLGLQSPHVLTNIVSTIIGSRIMKRKKMYISAFSQCKAKLKWMLKFSCTVISGAPQQCNMIGSPYDSQDRLISVSSIALRWFTSHGDDWIWIIRILIFGPFLQVHF